MEGARAGRPPLALLALLAAAPVLEASPSPAAAPRPGDLDAWARLAGRPVVEVAFTGNAILERSRLAASIYTEPSSRLPWGRREPFLPHELERDRRRLEILYREHGFPAADVTAGAEARGKGVRVQFTITEGPPLLVGEVRVAGWPDTAGVGPVRSALPVAAGRRLTRADLAAARELLTGRLKERGHWWAAVDADSVTGGSGAEITFRVDPGPVVHVREVEIEPLEPGALDDLPLWLIRDRVPIAPGAVLRPQILDRARQNLYRLDLFRRVAVEARPVGRDSADVAFGLASGRHRSYAYGVGYGSEEKVRLRASWEDRNFLGGLRRQVLEGRYSALGLSGSARLLQPRLFRTRTDLELRAFAALETEDNYDLERIGGGVRALRDLPLGFDLAVGAATEANDLTVKVADAALPEEGPSRLSELRVELGRDTSDHRLAATRGMRIRIEGHGSTSRFLSDFDYGGVEVEATRYLPIRAGQVLAGRFRSAVALPRGSTRELPIWRRLYAGGASSLRSYGRRTAGPLDVEGNGVGGELVLELVAEVRTHLFWRLGAVVFAEAGDVWAKVDDVDLGRLRTGLGSGLRIATPVGPARIDAGWKLSAFDPRLDPLAVHLSLGEAF